MKAEAINQITESRQMSGNSNESREVNEKILELTRRRPVTIREISRSFGLNINEAIKYLRPLLEDEQIKYKIYRNSRYYYC